MSPDEEKAFEDRIDGSDWRVPPKPDAMVIAELRAERDKLRAMLDRAFDEYIGGGEEPVSLHDAFVALRDGESPKAAQMPGVDCGMCKGTGRLVPTATQCAKCGLLRDMPGPLCWACEPKATPFTSSGAEKKA